MARGIWENAKLAMVSSDEDLAELLLPETVRHHIGLVHPKLCAKLVIEAYRIGYKMGREGRDLARETVVKRKQTSKQ
jgi:hypothetical protein